ncbi:MAG: YebC/PmpR family DNA-binding transcriptional regulator [Deltaproteobacteria bacterium]|jgi:YebC/PmpR family DNA-binding regulatory protein|nr:YebC/PmpR family DNA-binding transcriptional regulator [Deltaproteobacteria bacterium]
MSGHNKWSTIKHKKGAADAKRGRVFTKLIKEITIAARLGGGDPDGNPRLRSAIQSARAQNMPKDNIERAIKKGTGELEGVSYDELSYEGYGPGGVAILVECLTDNKNRTVADLKHIFDKHAGNLGETGCVGWLFEKKGIIVFEREGVDEEKLFELALDAGAEDVREEEVEFEIITDPSDFEAVKTALAEEGLREILAEVTMIPQNTVKLEGKKAEQMLKLMEGLEDNDDVSHVYANFDIPDEVMEAIG